MTAFLYFAASELPVSLDTTRSLGVGYAFAEGPASTRIAGRTPTGGPGWLFARGAALGELPLAYDPDSQVWRKIPGTEVMLGWYRDHPPIEASLRRHGQREGYPVELADGAPWRIPLLRFWSSELGFRSTLPQYADLDEDGNWLIGQTTEDCTRLDAIAQRLYDGMVTALVGDGSDDDKSELLTTEELLEFAVELLQANYYVSKIEIAALKILTVDGQLTRIAKAAIDYDRAERWAQKKTTESGLAESTTPPTQPGDAE